MTTQEIIIYAAERLLGKEVDTRDALAWMYDAMLLLGPACEQVASTNVVATADTWATLPSGFLRVSSVQDSHGYDYHEWETDETRIRFEDGDTYTVRYYEPPAQPTAAADEVPECPANLHHALAYYIAYRFESRDFPASPLAEEWRMLFYARVNEGKLAKAKGSRRIKMRLRW